MAMEAGDPITTPTSLNELSDALRALFTTFPTTEILTTEPTIDHHGTEGDRPHGT